MACPFDHWRGVVRIGCGFDFLFEFFDALERCAELFFDLLAFACVVGDALIARLSPLTLSKTNFNGMRVDIATPYLKVTGLGSRDELTVGRGRVSTGHAPPCRSVSARASVVE